MATLEQQPSTESVESGAASAAVERRRSPRHERHTPAWLSAASGNRQGSGVHIKIRDLSLHGAGFISDAELRTNDTHWMVVADQSLRLSTRVRIVNVRRREDGKWDIGGEFF